MTGPAALLLEVIYPGRCLACGRRLLTALPAGEEPAAAGEPVCAGCLAALEPLSGRRCRTCGAVLISEAEVCLPCRERTYAFRSHCALFEYRGVIKELIYQYKFQHRRRLAPLFARLLAEELHAIHPGVPVVPVPSRRPPAFGEAGLHVERIARVLERRHDVRIWRLLRRKGGVPQKALGFEERRHNIRGAVSLVSHPGPDRRYPSVVLLDDVFTTGATADECARVLVEAGCPEVQVLTLAMG